MTMTVKLQNAGGNWLAHVVAQDKRPDGSVIETPLATLNPGEFGTVHAHGNRDLVIREGAVHTPSPPEPKTAMVDAASDDRTANNAVRHAYRVLSDAEKADMVALKDMGAAFIAKCREMGNSRELSLAITKMEEAVMWAVKHVTA